MKNFDWMNMVDNININDDSVTFTLSHHARDGKIQELNVEAKLSTATIDGYNDSTGDCHDHEVLALESSTCTVIDFENVEAAKGQTFELTPLQKNTLEEFLMDFAA